jgi:TetR/AcrR family transcriptional repressor of nem operon
MPASSASTIASPQRRRGRPPKVDGDYRETREALCNAGVAALTEKGFSSTGIDEILRTVGVPKGSFYNFFASKEAFGAELITHYAAYFARKLDRFLLDERLTPLARIEAFCVDAERGMRRYGFRRGCLVGNLGQEMGALPESFRSQLVDVLQDWQQRLCACLEAAKKAREIPATADCAQWSEFFWVGWEGAVLRAKLERKAAPLRLFAQLFQAGVRR